MKDVQEKIEKEVVNSIYFRKILKIIKYIFFSLIPLIFAYYTFIADGLQVEPASILNGDITAFEIPFTIKNDGYLPLSKIKMDCIVGYVKAGNNTDLICDDGLKCIIQWQDKYTFNLKSKQSSTEYCQLKKIDFPQPIREADITVSIEYKKLYFFNKKKEIRFVKKDGLNWIPMPLIDEYPKGELIFNFSNED